VPVAISALMGPVLVMPGALEALEGQSKCSPVVMRSTWHSVQAIETKERQDQLIVQLTRSRRVHAKLQKELEAAEVHCYLPHL
jgi:hypothetical protein